MHEHIEILFAALAAALHVGRRKEPRTTVPRRRQPRTARATYVPTRRADAGPARFAH